MKSSALKRAGRSAVIPLITVLTAFVLAGLVMLVTGNDPLSSYGAIFDGTGLN